MIDWSKPLQTIGGADKVVFIAGPLDPTTAKLILHPSEFGDHKTHIVRIGNIFYGYDEAGSYYADGRTTLLDLINPPVKTVEYRTFSYRESGRLGCLSCSTRQEAAELAKGASVLWDGVVKLTKLDGKLTALRYFPLDDGEEQ